MNSFISSMQSADIARQRIEESARAVQRPTDLGPCLTHQKARAAGAPGAYAGTTPHAQVS